MSDVALLPAPNSGVDTVESAWSLSAEPLAAMTDPHRANTPLDFGMQLASIDMPEHARGISGLASLPGEVDASSFLV